MATGESNKSLLQTKDYPDKADTGAVRSLVMSYLDTINKSDLDGMVNFYAPDAVYMPEYSDPVVGTPGIRNSYRALFEAFTINATITVDEVVQVAPDWIFARCHSSGTMTVNHTGQPGPVVANQELFIFQRTNGSWKIARYSFSSRRPPSVAAK